MTELSSTAKEFWVALTIGLVPASIRLLLAAYLMEWPKHEAVFSDLVSFGLVMSATFVSNIREVTSDNWKVHVMLVIATIFLVVMYSVSLVPVAKPTAPYLFLGAALIATLVVVRLCWKRVKNDV